MPTLTIGGLANNGATPQKIKANDPSLSKNSSVTIGGANPVVSQPKSGIINLGSSNNTGGIGNNPGLISPHPVVKPTTAPKKITTTDTAGNITSTEYHKPEITSTNTPAPLSPPKIENGIIPPSTDQTGVNANGSTTNTNYTPPNQGTNGISQGGIIGNIIQAGQMTPEEKAANDDVKAANELQKAYQNVSTLAPYAEASMYSDRARTPAETEDIIKAPDLVGRAAGTAGLLGSLGNIYGSSRVAGANAALQGIQTQAARNLSANVSAAGANAPVSQFGLLTNPTTGEIVGGQGSNAQQLMNTSLSKAIELYNSGKTSFADAINISGLGQFGELGKSLLSSALISKDSNFNPTSQGTQINTNQSNLDTTQKQAFSVSQNLQQVDKIEPVLLNFLQTSGVNPFDAQVYNGPVKDYLSQIGNSGAAASWGAQMGELKNFTSQLIASGYGGTPTGAEAATLSQDPSNLSYKGLQTYLGTLKGLGNNRLSVLQKNIQDLGGTGIGYSGSPAQSVSSVSAGTPAKGELGSEVTSPAGQFGAGVGLDTAKGIGNVLTDGGNILSFILGKIF